MAAVRHLELEFCHSGPPKSQPCGPITVSKIGVDPIFPARDIAILWFCQFGWKMPNHAPFLFFGGLKLIVGGHPNLQKA